MMNKEDGFKIYQTKRDRQMVGLCGGVMEEDLKNPLKWLCARQCTDVVFFREQPQQNLAVFEALIGALRWKIFLVVY